MNLIMLRAICYGIRRASPTKKSRLDGHGERSSGAVIAIGRVESGLAALWVLRSGVHLF